MSDLDQKFMRLALVQAKFGSGLTSPNPRVGAVIVKNNVVLARGYHHAFGDVHAELDALSKLKTGEAEGATLYVNLEPCCHHGKTPPCTQAIKKNGISRLVYGMKDPNPQVNGKGLQELRAAGIEVSGPILEAEAREINRGYLKYRRTRRPWVTLKFAQSLDGRIAASTGHARWISNPESLKLAHRLRAEYDAVLVGINTALTDDPQLTVRLVRGKNPYRVVLDPNLRLPHDAKIFDADPQPVYIATRPYPPTEKADTLAARGAEFLWIPPGKSGALDLETVLDELGNKGFLYVLVEGGANVLSSFINRQLFDELIIVTAPIIIGGDGVPSVTAMNIKKVQEAIRFDILKRKNYGSDWAVWLRPLR